MEHIYSLRIRAPPKNSIDLIPINSDQNTLCNYDNVDGYCYFIAKNKKSRYT